MALDEGDAVVEAREPEGEGVAGGAGAGDEDFELGHCDGGVGGWWWVGGGCERLGYSVMLGFGEMIKLLWAVVRLCRLGYSF